MSGIAGNQALRDYLDWKKSLFLPLPSYLLENLKTVTALSQSLIEEISFEKNPELFGAEKRQTLLRLLALFSEALKPKSGGENDITKLSALAGEIMEIFREMQEYRKKGKLVLAEKCVAGFWQSLEAWNSILSQFRWIERTISAYISQLEMEAETAPPPADVKANMHKILKALPPL
ncbi:hypothetical protein FAI41_04000 [Acetobacteraceae bacterium]|nr:hypothetical protein FAI41_04000 [Acetobacteraceae bacterium]